MDLVNASLNGASSLQYGTNLDTPPRSRIRNTKRLIPPQYPKVSRDEIGNPTMFNPPARPCCKRHDRSLSL